MEDIQFGKYQVYNPEAFEENEEPLSDEAVLGEGWRDVRNELPVMNKDRKEEGFLWEKYIVYASDGILDYIGEGIYFPEINEWKIQFKLENIDLSRYVIAWMPIIVKPSFV